MLRSPPSASRNDPRAAKHDRIAPFCASLLCAHPSFPDVPQIILISSTILVHSYPFTKQRNSCGSSRYIFFPNAHTPVLTNPTSLQETHLPYSQPGSVVFFGVHRRLLISVAQTGCQTGAMRRLSPDAVSRYGTVLSWTAETCFRTLFFTDSLTHTHRILTTSPRRRHRRQ